MAENSFTERVKPAAFSIIVRDVFHFLTPDLRDSEKAGPVAPPTVSTLLRQLRPAPKDHRETTKFARQVVDPLCENEVI